MCQGWSAQNLDLPALRVWTGKNRERCQGIVRALDGLSRRVLHQPFLYVYGGGRALRLQAFVGAIGLHEAGAQVVFKVNIQQDVAQVLDVFRALDREDDLDPVRQVASHQVGAAQVEFFFAAIVKVENAAMFEVATDDADDANVTPSTPGTREHIPRTSKSTWTPA